MKGWNCIEEHSIVNFPDKDPHSECLCLMSRVRASFLYDMSIAL